MRCNSLFCLSLRYWQCLLIYLLVLVQRNSVNLHRHCRYHIRRFSIQNKSMQLLYVNGIIRHHIRCQEFSTAHSIKICHCGILNTRILTDYTLHFRQLNTETTDLHLSVISTNKIDAAIRQETYNVPCLIDALITFFLAKWIPDKYLLCLFRTVEISSSHLMSCYPQFSSHTRRQSSSLFIHYIQSDIIQRTTDWYSVIQPVYFLYRGKNGTLRWSISIVEAEILRCFHWHKLFPTHRKSLQRMILHLGCKLSSHLCGHETVGNAVLLKVSIQCHQIQTDTLINDMYTGTVGQCRIQIHHIRIESITCIRCNFRFRCQFIESPIPTAECCQVMMLQHNTFRHASGAGGVKQNK